MIDGMGATRIWIPMKGRFHGRRVRGNEERFPSGQREQTVNLPAMPSKVRILPSPPFFAGIAQLVEREPSKLGVAGSSPVSRSSLFCMEPMAYLRLPLAALLRGVQP